MLHCLKRMLADKQRDSFWQSYWGLLLTLSLGFVTFFIFSVFQSIFLIIYGVYFDPVHSSQNIDQMLTTLTYNGDAISFAEIPAVAIGISVLLLFTRLRKPPGISQYLKLELPAWKDLFKWLGVMVLIIIAMEVTYSLLNRNTPDFMTKMYSSATHYPLLWIAIIVAAPLFEELLFRGFLLEGIRNTPLGLIGAIVIPAASWAMIHVQYQTLEIITIFLIGIVFGLAKVRTGSLLVPIAMHMLMNLVATLSMELK